MNWKGGFGKRIFECEKRENGRAIETLRKWRIQNWEDVKVECQMIDRCRRISGGEEGKRGEKRGIVIRGLTFCALQKGENVACWG
jgi:hypothetical protein